MSDQDTLQSIISIGVSGKNVRLSIDSRFTEPHAPLVADAAKALGLCNYEFARGAHHAETPTLLEPDQAKGIAGEWRTGVAASWAAQKARTSAPVGSEKLITTG